MLCLISHNILPAIVPPPSSGPSPAPSSGSSPPPPRSPISSQQDLVTNDPSNKPVEESQHLENGFTFSPRPKSKLLDGSSSDSDQVDLNRYSARLDASDKWLTMNENRRQKKSKRKELETSPELANFKKQDKKSTPKNRRN